MNLENIRERSEYRIRKVANGYMIVPGPDLAYDEDEVFVFATVSDLVDHISKLWSDQ